MSVLFGDCSVIINEQLRLTSSVGYCNAEGYRGNMSLSPSCGVDVNGHKGAKLRASQDPGVTYTEGCRTYFSTLVNSPQMARFWSVTFCSLLVALASALMSNFHDDNNPLGISNGLGDARTDSVWPNAGWAPSFCSAGYDGCSVGQVCGPGGDCCQGSFCLWAMRFARR